MVRKELGRNMKEELLEIIYLVKICLTSIWFWIPVLFAAYLFIQFWLIFYVSPFAILVVPTILSIILVYKREKRLRMLYGIKETVPEKVGYISGSELGQQVVPKEYKWIIEETLEKYRRARRKTKKENK